MHQWYWNYQYPDFLSCSGVDFLEYDRYLTPENQVYSDNNTSVESTNVLPPIDTVINRDVLLETLRFQYHNNPRNIDIYSRSWEGTPGHLNQQLRLELASRYEASNEAWYRVESLQRGPSRGEKHLFYPGKGRAKARVTLTLLDVMRRNR